MGVSGSGKTTIGKWLANDIGLPFYDADDFHPEANIEKMKSGQPLNDEDRFPWLTILAESILEWNKKKGAVLACSALKKSYRGLLTSDNKSRCCFIYLKGSKKRISERLNQRDEHYMPPELLDSQFAALQEPQDAITVSIDQTPNEIVEECKKRLFEMNLLPGMKG